MVDSSRRATICKENLFADRGFSDAIASQLGEQLHCARKRSHRVTVAAPPRARRMLVRGTTTPATEVAASRAARLIFAVHLTSRSGVRAGGIATALVAIGGTAQSAVLTYAVSQ